MGTYSRLRILILTVFLPLLLLLGFDSSEAYAQIQIISRTLVSSVRVGPTEINYTYSLEVKNVGADARNVTAEATSFSSSATIVRGKLSFPNIPAGITAISTNTYTVRQSGNASVDQTLIRFAFSAISTPVANAGPDQLISSLNEAGSNGSGPLYCCLLNAGGSYDPFGLPLTYNWSIVSAPSGSRAFVYLPYSASIFIPDLPGDYVVKLVVNNGYRDSAPAYVRWSTVAVGPKADAGLSRTIKAGETVRLDGTHSVNPMNRPLKYEWSFVSSPAGSNPELSNAHHPRPTFLATRAGTYTLQLKVVDGDLTSAPATVTYTTGNTPPHADPGPDMHIAENSYGFLSANRSTDSDGDFLTYRWVILSATPGAQSPSLDPVPNPDIFVPGTAVFHIQLFVNDGYSESIATQLVAAEWLVQSSLLLPNDDVLPAIATVDPHGPNPGTFTLDGTPTLTSDFIQDSYWNLLRAPAGSTAQLTPAGNGMTATITPDEDGLYIAQYYNTIWAFNNYPTAVSFQKHGGLPVANPGTTQFGLWTAPALHTLDGSGSWDPDGRRLTYQWSLLSKPVGSSAALSRAKTASPSFTADVDGTYIFQLVVNNGLANSVPATVSIISKDSVVPTAFDISVRGLWNSPLGTPVTLLAADPLLDPYQMSGHIGSLPSDGFLQGDIGTNGYLGLWGSDPCVGGTECTTPESGYTAADTLLYIPFSLTWTGFDTFTYTVQDLGYPEGCRTPGNYCIAPKTSAPATVSIQVFEAGPPPP